jgi:phosphoglycerate dehydrogenase-like enzyme
VSKKTTVLVLSDPHEPQMRMLAELGAAADRVIGNSAEALKASAPHADVLLNWSGTLSVVREVFLMCRELRWIHSRSVGLERTLFPELIASDVTLTNGRGVFSASLGEFALAAILYFAKDLRRMIRSQQSGLWDPFDVTQVSGQTAGIVGYGDIGRAVAARARAVGMQVLALGRHARTKNERDPLVDQRYSPQERAELIRRSDYLIVAAPLNDETRGLIGEAEFSVMKETAVVINLGRGPVIEEGALIKALTERRIKGAALDVFDEEPLPPGHPFYKMENVLLSPHCADHTRDWLDNAMRFFLEQFERFLGGEPLLHVVNKRLGY